MDLAPRWQGRAPAPPPSSTERERSGGVPDDSSGESESHRLRRKFPRTTSIAEAEPRHASDLNAFRKPTLPASAMRPAGVDHRPSLSQSSQRRKSGLRENLRLPSGPRDFPGPGKRNISISSTAPSVAEASTTARTFLPHTTSDSFLVGSKRVGGGPTPFSFGNPSLSTGDADSPSTVPTDSRTENFDFLPDVNFDDFQTSIKNYDSSGPLLSDFPAVHGGAIVPKEDGYAMARANGSDPSTRRGVDLPQRPIADRLSKADPLSRTQSLRQKLAGSRQTSGTQQADAQDTHSPQSSISSLRDRRKSSAPPQTTPHIGSLPPVPAPRSPRKSLGPGLITSMMKSNGDKPGNSSAESSRKPSLARTNSLSKARRTTIQPSALGEADLPRTSTLTATTQSRANKVKSLQPPPREPADPLTPSSAQKSVKSSQSRSHTPSSSGNKRQSTVASGRISGLGARTISPTDARRLQRMTMMNAPPMPAVAPKAPPTPSAEPANFFSAPRLTEFPKRAQPSPSFIPKKASSTTPSSARTSPDVRPQPVGQPGLAHKSSVSSLLDRSGNGAASRLPTPKARPGASSNTSLAQYSDQYGERGSGDIVPPVPAIPKAYESPQDLDQPPFFSSSSVRKSSQTGFSDAMMDHFIDISSVRAPFASRSPRTSLDVPSGTPRKRSEELPRANHRRTLTGGTNGAVSVSAPSAPPKSERTQPDANGRKNANLQPLRLPPLNMMPISSHNGRQPSNVSLPRPSQEVDARDEFMNTLTPEPKRGAKTPSTPMTASKATFFRRQEDKASALRSASSHYALRDVMGVDVGGNLTTNFWDDSDIDAGVPLTNGKQRNAITPFASGSLPKSSGEFPRLRNLASGDAVDDPLLGTYPNISLQNFKPQGPRRRTQTNGTITSISSINGTTPQTPSSMESTNLDTPSNPSNKGEKSDKKEKEQSSSGGLRRKLSLGWRRSTSSKVGSHMESKDSPQQQKDDGERDREKEVELSKPPKVSTDMLPPRLPASATWSGDIGLLPSGSRPSLDAGGQLGHARRKSGLLNSLQNPSSTSVGGEQPTAAMAAGLKSRSVHTEQPQPVTSFPAAARAGPYPRSSISTRPPSKPKNLSIASISALVKDNDDVAADNEMHRLSRKRKDVDSAAREGEDLKKRAIARSPMGGEQVLHDRSLLGGSSLNVFERGEIVDYEKEGIFFTGTRNARKVVGSLTSAPGGDSKDKSGNNFGYDDERGDYNIVLGDHLAYRYEVVDTLGKGSFGQVVRCVDHKDGAVVAVKIIRNKKRFHQQALVEVGILGRLRDWDPDGTHATLSITGSFYFRSHLCIVTPCLSINLYELIRAHNFAGFNLLLIRRFARQLLACLALLQTKRIIHCDLKPENILLCDPRKADVRVIDFGSSCREEEKVYTYIQSRFYRSPEVILGSSYGLGIDMWSLGCILAELWTGYPLFPGENEQEQLACIMEIFGPPDRHLVDRCTRKKLFFDSVGKPRITVSSKGRRRRPSSKTLQQALKTEDEAFIDFVTRCLRWDPDRRLKPSEAISHPFITNSSMNQRPGVPDEARRAARVRSTAAVPAANGQVNPSPVKRALQAPTQPQQTSTASTPAKDRATRTQPETPQTALRNGVPAPSISSSLTHGSPAKPSVSYPNRRQSTVATASAAAVAGSKRASNGVVIGGVAAGPAPFIASGAQQVNPSGNLAQLAARESMGAAGGIQNSSRWRT